MCLYDNPVEFIIMNRSASSPAGDHLGDGNNFGSGVGEIVRSVQRAKQINGVDICAVRETTRPSRGRDRIGICC